MSGTASVEDAQSSSRAGDGFLGGLGHAVRANLMALVVSLLVTLLLPKLIGITDYSFWQLYVFYVGYVGVLQFGWNDGLYLRLGGRHYGDLDTTGLRSQFWLLLGLESALTLAGAALVLFLAPEGARLFIGLAVSVAITVLAGRQFCSLLLQATGRIREYARVTISESVTFLVLGVGVAAAGHRDFETFVLCDLVAKAASLAVGVWCCRDVVWGRPRSPRPELAEIRANIGAGISLMLANVAGILCVGGIRFGIERGGSVVEFGGVSLALSASNLLMVFFNSVGIVAFPALRRAGEQARGQLFLIVRTGYVALAFAFLLLYQPLRLALTAWLPAYERSFAFLALLLPMIVFEGKTAFLTTSYLKTLRRERQLLVSNVVALAVSVGLTVLTVAWWGRLDLAVGSILVVLVVRGVVAETLLGRALGVRLGLLQLEEVGLAVLFSAASWLWPGWQGTAAYALALTLVLVRRRRALSEARDWARARLPRGVGS